MERRRSPHNPIKARHIGIPERSVDEQRPFRLLPEIQSGRSLLSRAQIQRLGQA